MQNKTLVVYSLVFLIIAFAIHSYVHVAVIVSHSMNNTANEGDYVVYFKINKPGQKLKSNDIILFKEGHTTNVKRCIAFPRDTVSINNDTVYVNNKPHHEVPTIIKQDSINMIQCEDQKASKNIVFSNLIVPYKGFKIKLIKETVQIYESVIERNEGIEILEKDGQYLINGINASEFTFKHNYFFVMGDNRYNSFDSRHYGPIREKSIIGRVRLII